MAAPRIRANYEQLRALAQQFGREAATTGLLITNLRRNLETLRGGDWIGKGANAFYAEMDGVMLPAMLRLQQALVEGERITLAVSTRMHTGERDAAAVLKYKANSTAADVGSVAGQAVGAVAGGAGNTGSPSAGGPSAGGGGAGSARSSSTGGSSSSGGGGNSSSGSGAIGGAQASAVGGAQPSIGGVPIQALVNAAKMLATGGLNSLVNNAISGALAGNPLFEAANTSTSGGQQTIAQTLAIFASENRLLTEATNGLVNLAEIPNSPIQAIASFFSP